VRFDSQVRSQSCSPAYRLAILTLIAILIAPSAMLADCRLGFDSASHLDAGFAYLYNLNFDVDRNEPA
jgi:hypothetical protein